MTHSRIRAKICGITNRADAEAAIGLGADALGFNLYSGSKRCVQLEDEAKWIATLPPFVMRVAVLVDVPLDEARRVSDHPAIDCVQFHGDEDEIYCATFSREGRPFIKALRLRDAASIQVAPLFSTRNILLDADAGAAFGGTGKPIDLALAADLVRANPSLNVILAGGLRTENVSEAIRAVQPFAVDVASGVETADDPRRKDVSRLESFLAAVRQAG